MSSAAPQRRTSLARPTARAAVGSAVEQVRLRAVPRLPRLGSRAPRMPFVGLVSLLLLAGVIGLLLFNTSMQQASFTQTTLENRAQDLQARREALATDVERLRDPQRIAREARRQGMVPAPDSSYLDLATGTVSGPLLAADRSDDIAFPATRVLKPRELQAPPVQISQPDLADQKPDAKKDRERNAKKDAKKAARKHEQRKHDNKSARQRSGAPLHDRGATRR